MQLLISLLHSNYSEKNHYKMWDDQNPPAIKVLWFWLFRGRFLWFLVGSSVNSRKKNKNDLTDIDFINRVLLDLKGPELSSYP